MAKKMILVDDMDDTEGSDIKTIDFMLEGRPYEIDLSVKSATKLRDVLAPFIAKARRPSNNSAPKAAAKSAPKTDKAQLDAIRAWAKKNGHDISDRGRIPKDVEAAFLAATAAPVKKSAAKKAQPALVEA